MGCPQNYPLVGTILQVTSTTRPLGSDRYAGQRIYELDTSRELLYDGTGWVIMSEPAQAWIPSVSGFTIGTGGAAGAIGEYRRSDGWLSFSAALTLGTVGSSAAGAFVLTLPVAVGILRRSALAVCFRDTSTSLNYSGQTGVVGAGSALVALNVISEGGTYPYASNVGATAAIPFTWAFDDSIEISGSYRMTTRYS